MGSWRWPFHQVVTFTVVSYIAQNHMLSSQRQCISVAYLTVNAGQHDPGVVVRDDVSVAVLWFVDLQVGILPCELLARVNRLIETKEKTNKQKDRTIKTIIILCCFFNKKLFPKINELMFYLSCMYFLGIERVLHVRQRPSPVAMEKCSTWGDN